MPLVTRSWKCLYPTREPSSRNRAERLCGLSALPVLSHLPRAYRERLPNQLQRELHLSRRRCGWSCQPAGDGVYCSVWIQDVTIRFVRRIVVRMVSDVENLPAKLCIKRFRNSVNRVVLEQGEIEIVQTRSDHGIAARVPQEI